MFTDLRIGLAFTPYSNYNSTPLDEYNSKKMKESINSIKTALENLNYPVVLLPVDKEFLNRVGKDKPELIFNYSTGVCEKNSQVMTAALLEKTRLPYTASNMKAHFTALYKDLTKSVLISKGIPTPGFQIFETENQRLKEGLNFPLFVKPVHEGSSFGVDQNSVVRNLTQLKEKIQEINHLFHQPALVEEFIPGREFTLGILGNNQLELLPVMELKFNNFNNINTQENKKARTMEQICPAFIPQQFEEKLKELAFQTYKAVGCSDYARVDFRISNEGKIYVIEINTLPSLKPDRSSFITMARSAGYEYKGIINKIIAVAMKRYYLDRTKKEIPGV